MPRFRICIEDGRTVTRSKVFDAPSMEEARVQAEGESWEEENGWEEEGTDTWAEIRDELCEEATDDAEV